MIKKLVLGVALVLALTLGVSACSTSNVSKSKFESELESKVKHDWRGERPWDSVKNYVRHGYEVPRGEGSPQS